MSESSAQMEIILIRSHSVQVINRDLHLKHPALRLRRVVLSVTAVTNMNCCRRIAMDGQEEV